MKLIQLHDRIAKPLPTHSNNVRIRIPMLGLLWDFYGQLFCCLGSFLLSCTNSAYGLNNKQYLICRSDKLGDLPR